jgi:hypothetical protein
MVSDDLAIRHSLPSLGIGRPGCCPVDLWSKTARRLFVRRAVVAARSRGRAALWPGGGTASRRDRLALPGACTTTAANATGTEDSGGGGGRSSGCILRAAASAPMPCAAVAAKRPARWVWSTPKPLEEVRQAFFRARNLIQFNSIPLDCACPSNSLSSPALLAILVIVHVVGPGCGVGICQRFNRGQDPTLIPLPLTD